MSYSGEETVVKLLDRTMIASQGDTCSWLECAIDIDQKERIQVLYWSC